MYNKFFFHCASCYLAVFIAFSMTCYSQTKKVDFLQILRDSGPYDRSQPQDYPAFTYMSPRDPHLTELRHHFNLDSVAGKGNEAERAIKLLNWMHNEVPHADVINLPIQNALNIITTYQEKHTGQGCFPLSVSLNEIYLAMGFKSRSVICFSQSFQNTSGGHVINAVFINSLQKWVWMDPQNNAYLKDDHGVLQSVTEVREKMISGQKLVLNKDANYHQEPMSLKDYLYDFMVQHMYRFACPLNSAWDSQTISPDKLMVYIELMPVGSGTPPAGKFETQDTKYYKVKTYHTSNDLVFWQAPPAK